MLFDDDLSSSSYSSDSDELSSESNDNALVFLPSLPFDINFDIPEDITEKLLFSKSNFENRRLELLELAAKAQSNLISLEEFCYENLRKSNFRLTHLTVRLKNFDNKGIHPNLENSILQYLIAIEVAALNMRLKKY